MPIYDNDGTANREIGKIYDNDGYINREINTVYDNDGSANRLIFQSILPSRYIDPAPQITVGTRDDFVYSIGGSASFEGYNRLDILFASDHWQTTDFVRSLSYCGFYTPLIVPVAEQSGTGDNFVMGRGALFVTKTFDISGHNGTYYVGFRITARGGGITNIGIMSYAMLYNV